MEKVRAQRKRRCWVGLHSEDDSRDRVEQDEHRNATVCRITGGLYFFLMKTERCSRCALELK